MNHILRCIKLVIVIIFVIITVIFLSIKWSLGEHKIPISKNRNILPSTSFHISHKIKCLKSYDLPNGIME